VSEAALQYAILSDTPPADLDGGLDGLRVAFLGGYFTAALEDDIATMLERARVRVPASEVDISWSRDDNRAMSPVFTAEPGSFVLAHDPHPDPALYDPSTFADVEQSRALPAVEYLQARAALADAGRRCAAAAAGYDILLCASAPCPPAPLDGPDKTRRMNALTKPFNALRWPALSLPAGLDRDGLPLGLQVVGLPGADAVVLRASAALERLLQE
jgi:aspartyl-tRNA(Asn)/glutamyl-tRNA(Gln) amidotransferase subunit A